MAEAARCQRNSHLPSVPNRPMSQPPSTTILCTFCPNQVPVTTICRALGMIIGHMMCRCCTMNGCFIRSSAAQAAAACGSVPPGGSQRSVQCAVVVLGPVTVKLSATLAGACVPAELDVPVPGLLDAPAPGAVEVPLPGAVAVPQPTSRPAIATAHMLAVTASQCLERDGGVGIWALTTIGRALRAGGSAADRGCVFVSARLM